MNDTDKCLWCDTDISDKRADAKFCSAAHKLSFNRKEAIDKSLADKNLPVTMQVSKLPAKTEIKAESPLESFEIEPTPPKKRSNKPTPGSAEWYIHGTATDPNKTWDRVCVRCGEKYTTSLELRRFCSDTCFSEIVVPIANGPHENYKKWKLTA